VAVLFRSAGYQKRSYIRAFMPVVERLGKVLRFPEEIPRSLGTTLARRLEEDEDFGLHLRAALVALDNPSIADELALLRRMAGAGDDDAPPPAPKAPKASTGRPARAKASFQFDRPEGRARCVAEVGKLEIQLDRDFTTIDRRRLEQAVRAMLDALP
jgi:ParB family chromosome partitioning protein